MIEILESREQFESLDGGKLLVRAPAKINLNLLVGPRGGDGFHPLDSLVAKVTLYDEVILIRRSDAQVTLESRGFDCGPGEQNLALRAARAMQKSFGSGGVSIVLDKHIRPGSGLGGGSSDAAAVLLGMTRLEGLDIPACDLAGVAASLGSDVPLFLGPATARMTGRGETIEPREVADFSALLMVPEFGCSTPAVYAEFDRVLVHAGGQLAPEVTLGPADTWADRLENHLGDAAGRLYPEFKELRSLLAAGLGRAVCVSGSGSAMFSVFGTVEDAVVSAEGLGPELGRLCRIVRCNPW